MKAIYKNPTTKNTFHVDVLKFIGNGYAIIKFDSGRLDSVYVSNLRIVDSDDNIEVAKTNELIQKLDALLENSKK